MGQQIEWLIEHSLGIATFAVSLIVALLLYWLEKRRDDRQERQTNAFNDWMTDQTERITTMLETFQKYVEKSPSRSERQELVAGIERVFPGSVLIGDISIQRPALRIAQAFMGGAVFVKALAFGDEGKQLSREISKLEEGQVTSYVSPKGEQFLAEVKSAKIEEVTVDEIIAYEFRIELQIRR